MNILICVLMMLSSPFIFAEDPYAWMDGVIENQFAEFADGITLKNLDRAEAVFKDHEGQRFKIIGSKVFGKDGPIKQTLEDICALWTVPDVDFLYVWGDRVESTRRVKVPLLTGAKPMNLRGVVLFEDWYSRLAGWDAIAEATNMACLNSPWETKIGKLFWRGSGTDQFYSPETLSQAPRGRLVHLSKAYPDLIDAGFFYLHPWHVGDASKFWKTVGKKELIPYEDVPNYKYSIDLDGTTCSYPGFMWKLLMNTTVFKHESDQVMYFYSQVKPWVHYIPVKRDLSDLMEKLAWAREHDNEARQIAENGRAFALTNLMKEARLLYFYKVLIKYASLQQFIPDWPNSSEGASLPAKKKRVKRPRRHSDNSLTKNSP